MMKKYQLIKEKYLHCKEWIKKNPKEFYKYVMIILMISFGLIFVQYFFFTPNVSSSKIPSLYSKSDEVISKMDNNDHKMGEVVKELQDLKAKRDHGPLTQNDSLRIEYLFNQYQTLKNGH